jgi:hypothetical protein
MKPMPANPKIIIAQADGSGAAAASVTVVEDAELLAVKNKKAVVQVATLKRIRKGRIH